MKRRSFLKGTIGAGVLLAMGKGIKPEPTGHYVKPGVYMREVDYSYPIYHGKDYEAELTRLMAEELAKEIDREILQAIRNVS